MEHPLADRTAIVTGASRGIGLAIAERLAADGAHVGLVARSGDVLAEVSERILARGGGATVLQADITDPASSEAAVRRFVGLQGRVDILVNNAGGNVRTTAAETDLELWNRLLTLGLTAPFHWSQLCGEGMRERSWGRIVNIGSVAGMTALPTGAAYASAKAGLAQLTKNLAREWGPDGLTINLVAPWYVPTPLTEGVLSDPGFKEAVLGCTPSGRLGTPAEIAAAVAFLCREEAGWVNGVTLPLDGGFTAASFYP
ncbi:MAG: glucose 1-dehydrogenase [Planctomycetota bacterium]|nr:glucose 1-dehydrogenase [Planctomycetota bacterium]